MNMHKITKLKNGLTLITAPVPATKTATILVTIGTGSKYESKEINGISHFLEHMFFKGTTNRQTPLVLAAEMDSTGGDYNAFTSKEFTGFYMKVDATKLDKAIEIVSDMLINSKFEIAEMEREKGVIIEEINMYEDNPMMHIEDIFEQCLYGDTPAGWDTAGRKEVVSNLTREDFLNYYGSQYKTANTVICVAGSFKADTENKIEKYFKEFAQNTVDQKFKEKFKVAVNQKKPSLNLSYKKTDQAHLCLGVHAYPNGHKDEVALKLLSIILGGSMSSRLFSELREKRGLAYYVRTTVDAYSDCGHLSTAAGVKVDQIESAIEVILDEYKKIAIETVSEEELKRVKDLIKGKIVIQLESSDDVADWYGRQAITKLTQERTNAESREKIYSPEEFFKQIDKVSVKDIKRVAADIFQNSKLNLAVIGPYKDEEKFKKFLQF